MTSPVDFKHGLRSHTNLISLIAAATPLTLYTMPAGRTARLRKLQGFNGQAGSVTLEIGTGTAPFVQRLPPMFMVSGQDFYLTEDMLVGFEFTADITAQVSAAAAAPADVRIEGEVEVYQGPTG